MNFTLKDNKNGIEGGCRVKEEMTPQNLNFYAF